ncbi:hypothetical protein LCGC14_0851860 [marine sediment metagenome]|uniref:Uncharacterized protein n=1 Tax=marine sediment metagenome TaxID=412755 RepID=A0A0F9PEU5_9ZZZZ
MALSREVLERELGASKAALKAHEEGTEIHKIVSKVFEEELKKYPEKKKEEVNLIVK